MNIVEKMLVKRVEVIMDSIEKVSFDFKDVSNLDPLDVAKVSIKNKDVVNKLLSYQLQLSTLNSILGKS